MCSTLGMIINGFSSLNDTANTPVLFYNNKQQGYTKCVKGKPTGIRPGMHTGVYCLLKPLYVVAVETSFMVGICAQEIVCNMSIERRNNITNQVLFRQI